MHHFMVILAIVIYNTIAEENTCITEDLVPNGYYDYSLVCYYTQKTICTDLISNASSIARKTSCQENNQYCDELIILSSLLTNIDDKLIDSTSFCNLIILTINSSMITSISDNAFHSLHRLKLLNLNDNQIQDLYFLSELINLQTLSLEMNNLQALDAKDFRQLRKLTFLNLAHNNIQTLGNSSYIMDNLKELYLNHNNIKTLTNNQLNKLKRLEILNMANNEIEFIDENLLEPLTLLSYVNFGNNRIQKINDWIFPNSIKDLHLENNILKFPTKTTIWIKSNMLNLIDLSGCNISTLDNIFPSLSSLTILKMSNCTINEIVPFAFNSLNKLSSLYLNNNNLKSLRANYFAGLENLQELILEQNPIEVIDFQSFHGLSNLRTLNITVEKIVLSNYTFSDLKYVQSLNFVDSNILIVNNGSFSTNARLKNIQFINTSLQHIGEDGFANIKSVRCASSMCENENFGSEYVFNLSCLSLQSISDYAFQSVNEYFTNFYFNYNNITVIPKFVFSNSMANVISFNYSGIRNIEPTAFQNIVFGSNNYYQLYTSIFINNNNISVIKQHTL